VFQHDLPDTCGTLLRNGYTCREEMENMFPDYLEKIREAAAAGTCEGKDHYGYGVKDCQIPRLVMLVRLAADSPIYAEAIASLVESSRSVRFVLSRTLLHGHWDDTIVCGQFLFISFPDSVAKSFHHGGGPVLAVVQMHCWAVLKASHLFSRIVLHRSTRLFFTHVLHILTRGCSAKVLQ
jgi:hypothetical protein